MINTTGATSGAGTASTSGAPEFTPGFHVIQSLVLCVCLVDRCLFFFDIRIMITPLVSSNSSYQNFNWNTLLISKIRLNIVFFY